MSRRRGLFVPEPTAPLPPDIRERGKVLGSSTGQFQPGDPFDSTADAEYPVTSRATQVYLPEIQPIPGAIQFRRSARFNSPGAGAVEPAALQLRIPAQMIGVIRVFGYGLLAMTAATDVFWTLLFDGNPVPGYERIDFFPGLVPRVTATESDILVRFPQGCVISVRFTNVDGAVYDAGANYSGWFYTPEAAARWLGEG